MQVNNLVEREDYRISFEIKVDGEEWEKRLAKVSNVLQKQKAVPGYRAGKAPLAVAAKAYGKDLLDKAGAEATNELFARVCEEHDYAPVSVPRFMMVNNDLNSLEFICSFTTYPNIADYNYKGLTVEKPVVKCTEAEVDEAIDKYMHQHLYVHEVPREARMNDIVEVSFTGTCEGGHFEYDHSNKSRFTMGSGQLFAGLDEALLGHVGGDTLELSLTMPETFHREAVRGKTLDLVVNLKGVWARDLLECTEEYVKENIKDCDTLAEFREKQRKTVQDRYDRHCRDVYNKRVDKLLASTVTCPIPAEMMQTALDRYVATLRSLAAQQGKTAEQTLEEEGKTMETFIEMCKPSAEIQVRQSIALDHIIRLENIQVTREAVDKHFESAAKAAGISIEDAKKREGGEEGAIEKMLNNRALRLFKDSMIVNEVEYDAVPEE